MGLAASAGVAAGGLWLFTGGVPADLAYVPVNAQAFVSVRLADAWAGPGRAESPQAGVEGPAQSPRPS